MGVRLPPPAPYGVAVGSRLVSKTGCERGSIPRVMPSTRKGMLLWSGRRLEAGWVVMAAVRLRSLPPWRVPPDGRQPGSNPGGAETYGVRFFYPPPFSSHVHLTLIRALTNLTLSIRKPSLEAHLQCRCPQPLPCTLSRRSPGPCRWRARRSAKTSGTGMVPGPEAPCRTRTSTPTQEAPAPRGPGLSSFRRSLKPLILYPSPNGYGT